jgi:hypothetical protein
MAAMAARILTMVLALIFHAAPTIAQPSVPTFPRAPDVHPTTGLKFPSAVGSDTRLGRSVDYGRSEGRPERGYSLAYIVAPPIDGVAWVNVFNAGLTSIPTGPSSSVVAEQFELLLADIRTLTPEADGLKIVEQPTECLIGEIAFRCATLLAVTVSNQVPVYSTLLLTGYRDHFFSIWLEWNGTKADPTATRAYLNTLVSAIAR